MPDAYHRAIESARREALALAAQQQEELLRLLVEYADELAARVRAGLATHSETVALEAAREVIRELTREMAASVASGIRLTARRVAEIHARATLGLLGDAAIAEGVRAAFGGLALTTAQTVLARPELSRAFVTIRRESIEVVDRIIKRSILRGLSADSLEMQLRGHIIGAEAFPARLLRDRRLISKAAMETMGLEATAANAAMVRHEIGTIAIRARLIARTEIMTAQHETAVQAAIDSPVVRYVQWRTSTRHEVEDECDLLEKVDWYGHGPGLYDPRRVPKRPHPRCICLLTHVLRPPAEWGQPRGPMPRRVVRVSDVADLHELSPSRRRGLARALSTREAMAAA